MDLEPTSPLVRSPEPRRSPRSPPAPNGPLATLRRAPTERLSLEERDEFVRLRAAYQARVGALDQLHGPLSVPRLTQEQPVNASWSAQYDNVMLTLASDQLLAWGLDADWLDDLHARSSTLLELDLDLDITSDQLIVTRVSARNGEERASWDENGERDQEHAPYVTRIARIVSSNARKVTYVVPDFPKLLSDARSKLSRDVHNHYVVRGAGPSLDIDAEREMDYSPADIWLLREWLRMHDPSYLERFYGLRQPKTQEKFPRLLTDDELVTELLTGHATYEVGAYGPSGQAGFPRLQDISVELIEDPDGDIEYALSGSYPLGDFESINATLFRYVKARAAGVVFYLFESSYSTRAEAIAALFRLRHLVPVAARATQAAQAAPLAGTARPAYAELLPREAGFAPPSPPASYTRDEAEERWRAICTAGTVGARDVAALKRIADGLGIVTRATTAAGLCRAISAQHEIEFGERARLREAGERQHQRRERGEGLAPHDRTPTSAQVAELLASTAATTPKRRSPRRKTSSPRASS
jgi:hypothetical protein